MQREGISWAKNSVTGLQPFVCRDDYTAIGVCRGLQELGLRVPDDVAVVGHGDIDVAAYMMPALTTLVTPATRRLLRLRWI